MARLPRLYLPVSMESVSLISLLTVYLYLELNPVRANMVKHASEYPWSSFQRNGLGKPIQLLTPHALYRKLGKDDADRPRANRALFRGRMPEKDLLAIR